MAVDKLFRALNKTKDTAKLKKIKEIENYASDLIELYIEYINKKIIENTPNYKEFDKSNYEFRRAYKDGSISALKEIKSILGKGD